MKIKKDNIKHVINRIVDKEYDGWPPECLGLWYQPYRPEKQYDYKRRDAERIASKNCKNYNCIQTEENK